MATIDELFSQEEKAWAGKQTGFPLREHDEHAEERDFRLMAEGMVRPIIDEVNAHRSAHGKAEFALGTFDGGSPGKALFWLMTEGGNVGLKISVKRAHVSMRPHCMIELSPYLRTWPPHVEAGCLFNSLSYDTPDWQTPFKAKLVGAIVRFQL